MAGIARLDKRARALEAEGADPFRLEVLERARRFKRSWIDMAEALAQVEIRRSYQSWGYADLHGYCAEELLLQPRTVDKLAGSFRTLRRHAPDLLADRAKRDAPVPSYEAVDYFARALGEEGHAPAPRRPAELVRELKQAVFEEARPVSAIRREFNDALFSKSEAEQALQSLERTTAAVRRLQDVLPTVDGLRAERVTRATRALAELEEELDTLVEGARERALREARRAG